jgi:cardiolipin synthase
MHSGSLPIWIGLLIVGRDLALVLASTYYRYISLPPPKTVRRYFDLTIPSVEVNPSLISKINTFLQLGLMTMSLAGSVFEFSGSMCMTVLQYIFIFIFRSVVGVTTVWSGIHYVVGRNAFRFLYKNNNKNI